MNKLTKERLTALSNREKVGAICSDEIVEMARQLLGGLEQEPVIIVGDDGGDALAYRRLIQNFPAGTRLYAAPQLPQPAVVPSAELLSAMEEVLRISDRDHEAWHRARKGIADFRAAMLQGAEPVSQPYTLRDGYCIMPMKLTAENGAKGALSGEFSETKFINCPECFGDDECETCDGSGRIEISVPVSWTTIKEIWAKGVEHFAAAPQQEADNG